jgi:hypothetical protein
MDVNSARASTSSDGGKKGSLAERTLRKIIPADQTSIAGEWV